MAVFESFLALIPVAEKRLQEQNSAVPNRRQQSRVAAQGSMPLKRHDKDLGIASPSARVHCRNSQRMRQCVAIHHVHRT